MKKQTFNQINRDGLSKAEITQMATECSFVLMLADKTKDFDYMVKEFKNYLTFFVGIKLDYSEDAVAIWQNKGEKIKLYEIQR